jgi:transcriptional antiterminator NusG
MTEVTKKWYVVRAAGGKEKKAREYIENEVKRLHLEEYVSQVLIPTEKIYQVKNGKRSVRNASSIPGTF